MTNQPHQTSPAAEILDVGSIGVFVVDDHPGYRSLVGEVLAVTNGFEAAGGAASWRAAQTILSERAHLPDLVLMDVHLGDESGVTATRQLHQEWPDIKVILISTVDQADLPPDAVDCGADGFLPKARLSPREIAQAWRGAYDWQQ